MSPCNIRVLATLFTLVACLVPCTDAEPVINEFLADNSGGEGALLDVDGDEPDWIEIRNASATATNLAGWHLTDDVLQPAKWTFPAVTMQPGSLLIVFASGKNRALAGAELHTNFSLNPGGEYLALTRPDNSIASAFTPGFPQQREGVSHGIGRQTISPSLVTTTTAARTFLPVSQPVPAGWQGISFNDTTWLMTQAAIGFDDETSGNSLLNLLGYWNFDYSPNSSTAIDNSGRNNNATVIGASVTPLGGGRSGTVGDRAMDFRPANTGKTLQVNSAASGAFDSAVAANKLTVAFWSYGDATVLPNQNVAFHFSELADGSGARTALVHLPWSDGNIYFDTGGCCGPTETRIYKHEPVAANYLGRWNHYVFLKDGSRKEIWQNGVIWHSGTNTSPLTQLRGMWIGSANGGGINYPGLIDDFAVWGAALGADEITALAAGVPPNTLLSYSNVFRTNLMSQMRNQTASALLRVPFTLAAAPTFDSLVLRLRYDDGCIVYLNGTEVARRNVPAGAANGSLASSDRGKRDALTTEEIDLSAHIGLLQSGSNVLAIHGFNDAVNGGDFLIAPELVAAQSAPSRYFTTPTPGQPNSFGVSGFVADTQFTVDRGYYDTPFTTTITSGTPGATLIYTTDGSLPSATNGTVIPPPSPTLAPQATLSISGTTPLRAIATKADFLPTNADTQTYLFVDGVSSQPVNPAGYQVTWGTYQAWGPIIGQPVVADYEVDPEVTSTTLPGYGMRDALLALPSVCLTLPRDELFSTASGIYTNADLHGEAWERMASLEMLFPGSTEPAWQVNAGVRVHGGVSRYHWHSPKHSFRIDFRRDYGAPRLKKKLFPDSQGDSFDQLILRACSTDSWSVEPIDPNEWPNYRATYIRDTWMKDALRDLGHASGHQRYVHVYINGLYWGIYTLSELYVGAWQELYFGGKESDYDIIKDGNELEAGERTAWDNLMTLCNAGLTTAAAYQQVLGNSPDGTRNTAYPVLVDLPQFIDYMIVHLYSAARDWPAHNWWAARSRAATSPGFRFFVWDQEISNMNLTWTTNYSGTLIEQSADYGTPAFIYSKMRLNPSFQRRFGDRVHELLFNNGPLSPAGSSARWLARQAQLDKAIVAESARWGDARQSEPYKRETRWLPEMQWMQTTLWPQNHAPAVQRFRNVALYPSVDAPVFNQHGGAVNAGFQVTITNGPLVPTYPVIYYTTNGADPINAAGQPIAGALVYPTNQLTITSDTTVKTRVRGYLNGIYSALNSARFTVSPAANAARLVVSEIQYNPAPGGVEFVELFNVSAQTIDLSGVRLASAVDYTFPIGTSLAAGARVVVAADTALFATQYPGISSVGPFTGQLSNGGEILFVYSASNAEIARVEWGDSLPWPPAADGTGRSLTLIRPISGATYGSENWRSSVALGGTPGTGDSQPFVGNPNADADADGLHAFAEHALGTSDAQSTSNAVTASLVGQNFSATFQRRIASDDAIVSAEFSTDLVTWQNGSAFPIVSATPQIDGTEVIVCRATLPVGTTKAYARVRIVPRP